MTREEQIEEMLKDEYLPIISQQLNAAHPLLAKIKHSADNVWGKDVSPNTRTCSSLKNIYYTLRFTEEELRRCDVEHLNEKVHLFINEASINLSRRLLSNKIVPDDLTGVGTIFNGLSDEDALALLQPYTKTVEEITEESILSALHELRHDRNSAIDLILCPVALMEKYINSVCHGLDLLDLGNGYRALSVQGVPMFADRHLKNDTIYLLNTSCITLNQLEDWKWLEDESGRILRHRQGGSIEATLVKYAELTCNSYTKQGRIFITTGKKSKEEMT